MRLKQDDVVGGKYRIVRLIGDGGMGAVYEARHEVLGSPVALKFLHSELAKRPGLAQRFLQEARVSASIQSPHVTRVTDVDQTPEGSPYLVMELLTGESLQQLLDRDLKLDQDRALDFSLQILAGLEAAHALGVVHRDLKPDNVFITPSPGGPVLKLLDFGIAKLREANEYKKGLTRPGAVMGTPEYMAPEQLYAAYQVDHRADVYSLGAMLYEMLSGQRPADGDDAPSIIAKVAQGHVVRLDQHIPGLAPGLVQVVHRALEPDRDHRFASATDFRLALAPFAGSLSHAGRLAATPAPIAVAETDARTGTPAGTGQPPGGPRSAAVPPTLPPEDQDAAPTPIAMQTTDPAALPPTDPDGPAMDTAGKGSTQDAPKDVIAQLGNGAAPALASGTSAGAPTPLGPAYPPAGAPGAYGSPSRAYVSYAPPPPARPSQGSGRALGALLAVVLGGVVAAAVIAGIVVVRRQDSARELPPILPTTPETPAQTVSAQDTSVPLPVGAPEVSPPETPARPSQIGGATPGGGRPRDAGAGQGDVDSAAPPFSIPPWPSALPPIPSSIPTALPSSWPHIPGIGPAPDNGQ
jgi:serine/threonine protein kinase